MYIVPTHTRTELTNRHHLRLKRAKVSMKIRSIEYRRVGCARYNIIYVPRTHLYSFMDFGLILFFFIITNSYRSSYSWVIRNRTASRTRPVHKIYEHARTRGQGDVFGALKTGRTQHCIILEECVTSKHIILCLSLDTKTHEILKYQTKAAAAAVDV